MTLRIEQDGRLCRIALAGPEKRNVLNSQACRDLLSEIRNAAEDANTGAILLEADGPVFCGGLEEGTPPDQELFSIGGSVHKPIVAAVQGVALSAGMALAANAHVVVAAQGTSFGLTDVRDGRWSEVIYRAVARAVGERRALELSLTGRIFTAPEALAWGLVHHVAPAFELDDRATGVAMGLANANPDAIRAAMETKRV
ncbi:MAG TPA: enoyl-CoA hydratase/isomerase family protein [Bryobacteraceae bacterium]|jgi:enoyl-CoA hydratase/carnithine racemase